MLPSSTREAGEEWLLAKKPSGVGFLYTLCTQVGGPDCHVGSWLVFRVFVSVSIAMVPYLFIYLLQWAKVLTSKSFFFF